MGAMKREFERVADLLLTADYDTTLEELKRIEEITPLDAHLIAQLLDTMKLMCPMCECGSDYFEYIKEMRK